MTNDEIKIKLAQHETFETDRLILRKITIDDAQDLNEFASDPEVARYVTYTPHENLARTQTDIVNYFMPNRLDSWGVVLKATGKLIGTIDWRIVGDQAIFGWALHRAYWGQGLMPEAARTLRDFAFNELKLNVLVADHLVENPKSGRVMAKIGMKKLGQSYIYLKKLDRSALVDLWALTREDYEKEKAHENL